MNDRRYKYSLEYIGIHDTSKGFQLTGNPINRLIQCDEVQFNIEVACDILNELNDENKQLKQINRNLQDFRNFITEQNVSNEKQQKELQLQMLRLYNYFENWFEDAMSPTAFSEMWDNVKEDKKWEKGDIK